MRTIRLSDPFKHGPPAKKLEWGSSAWAADSCLVEWSTLEREWLGAPVAKQPMSRSWSWGAVASPRNVWLGLALLGSAIVVATWG